MSSTDSISAQTDRLINYALVGCGMHSTEVILPSLLAVDGVRCLWVSDPDREASRQASNRLGSCPAFSNWDAGFQYKTPDAVVVVATPQVHFSVAKYSLEHGLPVFVEKPPAVSLTDIQALASIAACRKIPTMVGHNFRHSEAGRNMRRIVNEESFGRTDTIQVQYFASKPRGDRWQLDCPVRAFFLSHLTHAIDYFLFLVKTNSVQIRSACLSRADNGVSVSVLLELLGGGIGTILASNLAPYFDFSADVLSTEQILVRQSGTRQIEVFSPKFDKRWGQLWVPKTLQAGVDMVGYQGELAVFFGAVRSKDFLLSSPSFADEVAVFSLMAEINRKLAIED